MNRYRHLPSPLYQRLVKLRRALPLVAVCLVFVQEVLEHSWLHSLPMFHYMVAETLIYGAIWSGIGYFFLTLLTRRVRERDRAETHLRSLYDLSREVIAARNIQALVDVALRMPEQVVEPVGTVVLLQEHPEVPWTLAGARGLTEQQRTALEARLMTAGAGLRCNGCTTLASTSQERCPLLSALPEELEPAGASVICLPLSTGRPLHAVLNVFLPEGVELTPVEHQMLESMTSGLAVALDHTRLRSRELEMLQRVEEVVRKGAGLTTTLEHSLADIVTASRAEIGVAFLASGTNGDTALIRVASWPDSEIDPALITLARQAYLEGCSLATLDVGGAGDAVALPLVAEGEAAGALVLAGRQLLVTPEPALLNVVAGMIGLVVRNSQLYAELESQAVLEERSRVAREVHDGLAQGLGSLNFRIQQVDRLLARGHWEAARQALWGLRDGVQGLYDEVRRTIRDLRWPLEGDQNLSERLSEYVAAFASRTGIDVSLSVEGDPDLCPRSEVQLLRITQEALTNVHRHAQARRVWVRLAPCPDGNILEIEDDGVGLPAEFASGELPPEAEGHFGLRIIRERTESMGGQMCVCSAPGKGTKLQILVPSRENTMQPRTGNDLVCSVTPDSLPR